MNDQPPQRPQPLPLPPRLIVLRTTPEILKQTTTSIFSTGQNLLMILLLSLSLLSFRSNIETTTHFLTSFIDSNPSFKSVIDRNNGPPNPTSTITTIGSLLKPQLNATSFILDSFDPQLGFSNLLSDNGIRATETVSSTAKMTFRLNEIIQKEENIFVDEINISSPINEMADNRSYFQSFLKRFDLEHHEFTAITNFALAFVASYCITIHVFVDTYSKVHGIIFVSLVNDFCNRHQSFRSNFWNGSTLGPKRLAVFIPIRWAIRDVFTQVMCSWFFGKFDDPYSLIKFIVRSKYISFSIMTPWDEVFEKEFVGFIISCFLLDMIMSMVFGMGAWIVMADSRKNVKDAVKESCHLLSLMIQPAIELKCYECIICGVYARWVFTPSFGMFSVLAFQYFMEVYFMVAWMIYYLSLKSIDANSKGQPFGQRELEAMLRDV